MTSITLDDEVAEALKTLEIQARDRQMAFHAYLQTLAQWGAPEPKRRPTLDEFRSVLRQFENYPRAKGSLPGDFSRDDIYLDHD